MLYHASYLCGVLLLRMHLVKRLSELPQITQTKYDISAAVTLKTLMKMLRDYACPAHQLCVTVI
jgi:hypothetical protein